MTCVEHKDVLNAGQACLGARVRCDSRAEGRDALAGLGENREE